MERIDAHIHLLGDDAESIALLEELDLKLLDICVAEGAWRAEMRTPYRELSRRHPARYAWCTTFDLPDYRGSDAEYAERVIEELRSDFADGAIAVKAWKNIGMELRAPDGRAVLIDDPIFDPIYGFLSAQRMPILMHIGEPLECWLPLREGSVHYGYYSRFPEWHMHGRTDLPSHADLMDARDHVLAKHPKLRLIGAHLGSLEYDVAEIAKRFDRYPNFAVDISARLADLMSQPAGKVRDFFLAYPDRILFGTDIGSPRLHSTMAPEERARKFAEWRGMYDEHTRYFETTEQVKVLGQESPGIELPPDVLRRFYVTNAREWYPGL